MGKNHKMTVILYLFLDMLCAGAGMGVPIFCILLGFPLGWYITKKINLSAEYAHHILQIKWFSTLVRRNNRKTSLYLQFGMGKTT